MATMLIDRDFDNPLVNQSSGQKTRSYGGSESSSKEWFWILKSLDEFLDKSKSGRWTIQSDQSGLDSKVLSRSLRPYNGDFVWDQKSVTSDEKVLKLFRFSRFQALISNVEN